MSWFGFVTPWSSRALDAGSSDGKPRPGRRTTINSSTSSTPESPSSAPMPSSGVSLEEFLEPLPPQWGEAKQATPYTMRRRTMKRRT